MTVDLTRVVILPRDTRTRAQRSADSEVDYKIYLAKINAVPMWDEWKGTNQPHKLQCEFGHTVYPRPNDVQQGQGICRVCAGRDPQSAATRFRQRLIELNATPLWTVWLGANEPHKILCEFNHLCTPSPNNVMRGQGICKICARQDPIFAEQNFMNLLEELGATPVWDKWIGANKPHKVICRNDHECWVYYSNIYNGRGVCHFCAGMDWDVIYVVMSDKLKRVKFGITSGDPRPRLSAHRSTGYNRTLYIATNIDARPVETDIKISLAIAGFNPIHGWEYFDINALATIMSTLESYGLNNEWQGE